MIKVRLTSSSGHATLVVKDTGVGIPKDKLKAIFTKFMRVDNELSVPAGGTGLGLYLALKIIKLHRGDITVTSELGTGSEFRVLVPLGQTKEDPL
jgi:signal transduction histidine kinase